MVSSGEHPPESSDSFSADSFRFPSPDPLMWAIGIFFGILVGVEIFLLNLFLQLLEGTHADKPGLAKLPISFPVDQSPLLSAVEVLIGFLIISIVHGIVFFVILRISAMRSSEFGTKIYRAIVRKNSVRSIALSVSGQQSKLKEAMAVHLPGSRNAALIRDRDLPRQIATLVACSVAALLIHPMLSILVVVCFVLSGMWFRQLDRKDAAMEPVLLERLQNARNRTEAICLAGPLLESVHAASATEAVLKEQLMAFEHSELALQKPLTIKKPLEWMVVAIILTLIGFAIAVQVLNKESPLRLSGAVALAAALATGFYAWGSILKSQPELHRGTIATRTLKQILNAPVSGRDDANQSLDHLASQVAMKDLTLHDSEGHKLLEQVSLTLRSGELVAIISTDPVQGRALAELVLGFGKPTSGSMTIDSLDATAISAKSMRQNSTWIAADGPLIAGSIEENLYPMGRPNQIGELTDAIKAAGVYDAIQNLADGLATMVAPNDDRLKPDDLFRLGIARAILKQPALIVAEEPTVKVSSAVEAETLQALKQLTERGSLVVVIPHRLSTLRNADQIVVVHDHRVVGVGNHIQLLEKNELYRHLNYIHFSPLKHIGLNQ